MLIWKVINVMKLQVTTQCSKTLEVEGVAGEVELPRPVMADMISNIVTLSRNVLLMDASSFVAPIRFFFHNT